MLYYFFIWLKQQFHISGTGIFQYITFRAALAIILSLIITTVFGKRVILFLQKKQIGESVRELGLAGENAKKGTPTMGGLIILMGILIPTLLDLTTAIAVGAGSNSKYEITTFTINFILFSVSVYYLFKLKRNK